VLGPRKKVVVVLDWTDFDKDDQTTLSLCLLTRHGRATPLLWKTYRKSELAGERTAAERRLLAQWNEPLLCAFDQVLADHSISLEILGEI
jgi:hypothetical protein